jgi:purine-binding chemotaxis protein CheW
MPFEVDANTPWVVFRLTDEMYALPALQVQTMVETPRTIEMPRAPEYVRGAINLRGKILSLTDLRVRLGMPSKLRERDELVELLRAREQDHLNWIQELEASVREEREFSLQLDPRLCAFGKWFYSYEPADALVAALLRKFEGPHNAIHALGNEVHALREKGETDAALARIEETRNGELSAMLHLFEALRQQIRESLTDISVVVESANTVGAFAVDAVESVEYLDPETFQPVDAALTHGAEDVLLGTARRKRDDAVVLVLSPEALLGIAEDAASDVDEATGDAPEMVAEAAPA